MTRELQSGRRGPDKAGSVIVFLHGYGADGADLLGLAEPVIASVLAVLLFAEVPSGVALVGMAAVLASIGVVVRGRG